MARTVSFCVMAAMILCFAGCSPAQSTNHAPQISDFDVVFEKVTMETPGSLWQLPESSNILVVDESGKPLADATIEWSAMKRPDIHSLEYVTVYQEEFRTDKDGKAEIFHDEFSKNKFDLIAIKTSYHGFVPVTLNIDGTGNRKTVIPKTIIIPLVGGKTCMLEVVDQDGNGMEGVTVDVQLYPTNQYRPDPSLNARPYSLESVIVTTDHNGKCKIGPVPETDNLVEIRSFQVTPLDDRFASQIIYRKSIPERYVVQKKPECSGRVTDEAGNPVAGAKVMYPGGAQGNQFVITDKDGRYRFLWSDPGRPFVFRVEASGMKPADAREGQSDITLQKGSLIRVHAVDEQGNTLSPLAVREYFEDVAQNSNRYTDIVPGRMVEDGIWEWGDAPRRELWTWVHLQDAPFKKGEISEVWEVLRFNNPFDFPMTTAPASVSADGRFLGQNSSYWTAPGTELTVPITRAMSVQVISDEEERGGKLEPWEIIDPSGNIVQNNEKRPTLYSFNRSGRYRKQTVDATLTVKNLRKENVKITVTREIMGEYLKSASSPEVKILVEPNSNVFNRTHELKWDLTLKPGETRKIEYSYERFVPY